jgi:hypothetical protein
MAWDAFDCLRKKISYAARILFGEANEKFMASHTMVKRSGACFSFISSTKDYGLSETEDNSSSLDSRSFHPLPYAWI